MRVTRKAVDGVASTEGSGIHLRASRPGVGVPPPEWDTGQDCPICGALQCKERREPMCEACHTERVNSYWRNRMAELREKHK